MDLNELVGDFKLGMFEHLPPDTKYYIRGEGVLARLDRIKNGSTVLNSNDFQLFFENEEDRKEAISAFSSRNEIRITDHSKESIELETNDQNLRFFRPTINSAKTLVGLAQLTIFSTVIERKKNGEASIFSVDTAESDIANRKIRLCRKPITKQTYKQIFKLVRAGFDPSDKLIAELPTTGKKKDPAERQDEKKR